MLAEPGLPIADTAQDSEPVSGLALRSDPVSGLTTVPAEQDGPTTLGDPYLALPDPGPTTTEPATEPVPVAAVEKETAPVGPDHSPLDFEPELVAIEESDPLPLLAGEASATEPVVLYTEKEEYSYQPYVLVETLEGTLQNAAANALSILVDEAHSWSTAVEGEGLVGTTFAGLFYGENAGHSPASEPNGETRSSSTGTGPEWPLQDTGPTTGLPLHAAGGKLLLPVGRTGRRRCRRPAVLCFCLRLDPAATRVQALVELLRAAETKLGAATPPGAARVTPLWYTPRSPDNEPRCSPTRTSVLR